MNGPPRTPAPREKMLCRYFRPVPRPPEVVESYRWLGLGGALLLVSLVVLLAVGDCAGLVIAAAAAVGGGALAWRGGRRLLSEKYRYQKAMVDLFPQPSDREVDQWLGEGLARLRSHSLERLDLTPEDCEDVELPPIIGPVLWHKGGIAPEDVVWKPGQDGMARFGVYQVSYIWLADDHAGIFRCDYDLIRDAVLNEEMNEFFYQDIISVSTIEKASSLTLPTGYSLTSFQEFRISVANERYFAITVGSRQLKQLTGAERTPDDGTETVIRALRAKLKAKKGSLLGG